LLHGNFGLDPAPAVRFCAALPANALLGAFFVCFARFLTAHLSKNEEIPAAAVKFSKCG
jgi:hypothetical protein